MRYCEEFIPVTGMKCSYGKIFQPAYRDPGWKKLRSREPSQAALSYDHIEKFYKGFRSKARSRKPGQPGQQGSYEKALSAPDHIE